MAATVIRGRLRFSTRSRCKAARCLRSKKACYDGEETIDIDEDLIIGNIKNIQVTDEETSAVHVCTECGVAKDLITGKPDKDLSVIETKELLRYTVRNVKRRRARYQRKNSPPLNRRKTRTVAKPQPKSK